VTVPVQTPIASYIGNGATVAFTVPFRVIEAADLSILVNGSLVTTGFELSGLGDDEGTVTFSTAPASGSKLIFVRDVALERDTDYQTNGDFLSTIVNADFDRIWMALQDIGDTSGRAIRFPITEYGTDGTLPVAASRALTVLSFDSNGNITLIPIPTSVGAGDLRTDKFLAANGDFVAGVTRAFTLSRDPGSADNVFAWWDGTPQFDFVLTGNTLTFNEPVYAGTSAVRIRTGTTLSLYTPASGSVGDGALQFGDLLSRCFTSIASLRATNDSRYRVALVTGYYAPHDGGGGPYVVDAADTTSADNGGSIIVDALGRRWKLNTPPDWYVEQFGAKGDGVTDDAPAINAALAAVPARGGTVRLMGKTYGVASGLVIGNGDGGTTASTINGIRLIGQGGGLGARPNPPTTLQAIATIDGPLLRAAGSINDVVLEGFCIYGSLLAKIGLEMIASCGTQIRNVSIKQFNYAGLYWHAGNAISGNYNIHNEIHNVDVTTTANNHFGLLMDGDYASVNDTWLTSFYNCRFDTTSATGSSAAYFQFVDSCTFHRCHFTGNNTAGVGLSGCHGIYFNAVGNDQYPGGMAFHDCSILSMFVNESASEKIGYMSFINLGVDDNETIPSHTKLRGFTIHGTPFNGWGS
jgi:hypothetical protein